MAGESLQEIQHLIGNRDPLPEAQIRFPRGYVVPVGRRYHLLPEIGSNTKRRNFTYRLLAADVLRWMLDRTDVYGQVASALTAEYVCILAFGAEFFVKECTIGKFGRKRPFAAHTANLVDRRHISANLKAELDWMWDVRTREHLDSTDDLDLCTHTRADFVRAQAAWIEFLRSINRNLRRIKAELEF